MRNSTSEPFFLGVAEDEIGDENFKPIPFYFMDPRNHQATDITDELHLLLSQERSYDRITESVRDLKAREAIQSMIRGNIAQTLSLISPDARAVLSDEKISAPLVMLINSGGGLRIIQENASKVVDMIHRREGKVYAYAGPWVMSAAANLWGEADVRYAMKGTKAMWHAGANVDSNGNVHRNPEEVERDRQRLISFFSTHTTEPSQSTLLSTLKDPINTTAELRLEGSQLKESGLAEEIFPDEEAMLRHIQITTGWDIDLSRGDDPIEDFYMHCQDDVIGQMLDHDYRLDGVPRQNRTGKTNDLLAQLIRGVTRGKR